LKGERPMSTRNFQWGLENLEENQSGSKLAQSPSFPRRSPNKKLH
jgi:hypothetical protein